MQSVFCILWLTVYFILAPKALFHLLVTNQEKQQGSPKQWRRRAGKEGVWIFSVKANRSPLTLTPLFLDLFLDRKKKVQELQLSGGCNTEQKLFVVTTQSGKLR